MAIDDRSIIHQRDDQRRDSRCCGAVEALARLVIWDGNDLRAELSALPQQE
jgi:hypothetical protein